MIVNRRRRDDAGRRFGGTGSMTGSSSLSGVKTQAERLGQMQGCLVERQSVERGPEVQHVARGSAGAVEALEHVAVQVDRELTAAEVLAAMDRTGQRVQPESGRRAP